MNALNELDPTFKYLIKGHEFRKHLLSGQFTTKDNQVLKAQEIIQRLSADDKQFDESTRRIFNQLAEQLQIVTTIMGFAHVKPFQTTPSDADNWIKLIQEIWMQAKKAVPPKRDFATISEDAEDTIEHENFDLVSTTSMSDSSQLSGVTSAASISETDSPMEQEVVSAEPSVEKLTQGLTKEEEIKSTHEMKPHQLSMFGKAQKVLRQRFTDTGQQEKVVERIDQLIQDIRNKFKDQPNLLENLQLSKIEEELKVLNEANNLSGLKVLKHKLKALKHLDANAVSYFHGTLSLERAEKRLKDMYRANLHQHDKDEGLYLLFLDKENDKLTFIALTPRREKEPDIENHTLTFKNNKLWVSSGKKEYRQRSVSSYVSSYFKLFKPCQRADLTTINGNIIKYLNNLKRLIIDKDYEILKRQYDLMDQTNVHELDDLIHKLNVLSSLGPTLLRSFRGDLTQEATLQLIQRYRALYPKQSFYFLSWNQEKGVLSVNMFDADTRQKGSLAKLHNEETLRTKINVLDFNDYKKVFLRYEKGQVEATEYVSITDYMREHFSMCKPIASCSPDSKLTGSKYFNI